MRILLLSRYGRMGASSRLRSFQYLPFLTSAGIEVVVNPLLDNDYLQSLYFGRVSFLHVYSAYVKRTLAILARRKFDVLWVEKEIFPWLPASFEKMLLPNGMRLVLDYDDALFHRYNMHKNPIVRVLFGNKIDAIMKRADLVVAGNSYLANRALNAGCKRVEIIPTVIDLDRYPVARVNSDRKPLIIGWVGSPSTANYLKIVSNALKGLRDKHDVNFVAVGARPDQVADTVFSSKKWSEKTEASEICKFAVGIMPLPDMAWEQGKCGYKLIQYMACGLPVVASPVGVNSEIVTDEGNGYLASSPNEWSRALDDLLGDANLRHRMGVAGRQLVENQYCVQKTAPLLVSLLRTVD